MDANNNSQQLEKLSFIVYDCTSRDDNHHERTLEVNTQQQQYSNTNTNTTTKGWLSSPNCTYPQTIILQFLPVNTTYNVRKIQILSHQNKIASSIEIHIGNNDMQFNRLGYMSLDSNQRSEYKARELKSVYINAKGSFLKLVIKSCHINDLNPFNQVGIVAINVMGTYAHDNNMLQQQQHSIMTNPHNMQQPSSSLQHAGQQQLYNSMPYDNVYSNNANNITPVAHSQQAYQQQSIISLQSHSRVNSNSSTALLNNLDPVTAKKLNELELSKQQAIDNEDYDEAKRLKMLVDGVKRVAVQLNELESKKLLAVQQEDYDLAKQLKKQIDVLRLQIQHGQTSSNNNTQQQSAYSPHYIQQSINGYSPHGRPAQQQQQQQSLSPHLMQKSTSQATLYSQQPQQTTYNTYDDDRPIKPMGNKNNNNNINGMPTVNDYATARSQLSTAQSHISQQPHQQHIAQPIAIQPQVLLTNDYNDDMSQQSVVEDYYAAPQQRIDINDDRPLHKGAQANNQFFVDDIKNNEQDDTVNDIDDNSAGVEQLSLANKKDAEHLIEIYSEPTCELLYSKSWTNRVNGAKQIQNDLTDHVANNTLHADDKTLFMTVVKILKRLLNDKVAHVLVESCNLLDTSMIALSSSIKGDELRSLLDPIVLLLIDKLGDANTRVRDTASNTLLNLAFNKLHGLSLIATHLMSPLKKKEVDKPIPIKTRSKLLLKLLQKYNISDRHNLNVNSIMNYSIPYLQHRDVSVRDSIINLIAYLAFIVGNNKLESYYKNIRPVTLDTLLQRIDEVQQGKHQFSPLQTSRNIVQQNTVDNSIIQQQHHQQQHQLPTSQHVSRRTTLQKQQQVQSIQAPLQQQQHSPRDFTVNQHSSINDTDDNNVRTDIEQDQYDNEQFDNISHRDFNNNNIIQHSDILSQQHQQQGNDALSNAPIGSDVDDTDEIADHLADQSIVDDSLDMSGKCQFCGLEDSTFTEERLDLHYWQDCPMLCSCKHCEQVIEISTLDEHLLHECEINGLYEQCINCKQPIPTEQYAQHTSNQQCQPPVQGIARCM